MLIKCSPVKKSVPVGWKEVNSMYDIRKMTGRVLLTTNISITSVLCRLLENMIRKQKDGFLAERIS